MPKTVMGFFGRGRERARNGAYVSHAQFQGFPFPRGAKWRRVDVCDSEGESWDGGFRRTIDRGCLRGVCVVSACYLRAICVLFDCHLRAATACCLRWLFLAWSVHTFARPYRGLHKKRSRTPKGAVADVCLNRLVLLVWLGGVGDWIVFWVQKAGCEAELYVFICVSTVCYQF